MMGNAPGPRGDAEAVGLKELLEKNLKWSQIIYEQNRRISRKLAWAAVASWLRFLIIAVPIILGLLYLPPLIRQYRCLFKKDASCPKNSGASFDNLLKSLPFDQSQRVKLQEILK